MLDPPLKSSVFPSSFPMSRFFGLARADSSIFFSVTWLAADFFIISLSKEGNWVFPILNQKEWRGMKGNIDVSTGISILCRPAGLGIYFVKRQRRLTNVYRCSYLEAM
jgi:hypothetical protein